MDSYPGTTGITEKDKQCLARTFDNVKSAKSYLAFLALLRRVRITKNDSEGKIEFLDLIAEMLCLAWFASCRNGVNLGLTQIGDWSSLSPWLKLPVGADVFIQVRPEILRRLKEKQIGFDSSNFLCRLNYSFFESMVAGQPELSVDKRLSELSRKLFNSHCPFFQFTTQNSLIVHPKWRWYFYTLNDPLTDWTTRQFAIYLADLNPLIAGLSEFLSPGQERDSAFRQPSEPLAQFTKTVQPSALKHPVTENSLRQEAYDPPSCNRTATGTSEIISSHDELACLAFPELRDILQKAFSISDGMTDAEFDMIIKEEILCTLDVAELSELVRQALHCLDKLRKQISPSHDGVAILAKLPKLTGVLLRTLRARDGITEGEFDKILRNEIREMDKAELSELIRQALLYFLGCRQLDKVLARERFGDAREILQAQEPHSPSLSTQTPLFRKGTSPAQATLKKQPWSSPSLPLLSNSRTSSQNLPLSVSKAGRRQDRREKLMRILDGKR